MISYAGNGNYCYANSLHMSLLSAGAASNELPTPSFIECLTTMPFGNLYLDLDSGPIAFFSPVTLDPNLGLARAAKTLGWTFNEQRGGTAEEALARLRAKVREGVVLVGPIDMGYLSYNPNHQYQMGGDHFVAVMAIENEHVLMHDPQGYPCAFLPVQEFLNAWQADSINYKEAPFTMRSKFRHVEQVSRQKMIERTLPLIRENLTANPGGPVAYGGVEALTLMAQTLRDEAASDLKGTMQYFALPLAAKRNMDGAAFLHEAGKEEAAQIMERQAVLYGEAQYHAAHGQWEKVADLIERVAELEQQLIAAV